MNLKQLFVAALVLLSGFVSEAQTNRFVTLVWTPSVSETGDTNAEFYVLHHSTNAALPLVNWEVIATVAAGTGSNQAQVSLPMGLHLFYLTFSNMWEESVPSNIAKTPPAPITPNGLRILRLSLTP